MNRIQPNVEITYSRLIKIPFVNIADNLLLYTILIV